MQPTNVTVVQHPLVEHHLAIVRDETTTSSQFRSSLSQLSSIVAITATADLKLKPTTLRTPIQQVGGFRLDQRIGLIPILRAGIGMVDPVLNLIPDAEVWHLGLYRDETTAEPVHYYSKMPADRPVDVAIVLDPMLATGGSACLACDSMHGWGVGQTILLSVIAAPEGIDKVSREFPNTTIYTCAIDQRLNEQKFIVPGLGDAGDRVFNTA